jgi:hypothetical protein
MMNKLFISGVVLLSLLATACHDSLLHHTVHDKVLLKDSVYLSIKAEFCTESPEALREIQVKNSQLRFAMTIALREHSSTELQRRGKRSVQNALESIARQLLDHPVKEIHLTTYDFQAKPSSGDRQISSK